MVQAGRAAGMAARILDRPGILLVAGLVASILVWLGPGPAWAGPPSQLPGDTSCDGVVNSVDAALVLQFDAGLIVSVPCAAVADISRDGSINSLDAAIILQYDAGLVRRCPVVQGEPAQGLVATLVLDGNQSTFPQGKPISLFLSITNCDNEPMRRQYGSSQLYDFVVRDSGGQEVWRWSHGIVFLTVRTYQTFQPGETVTYTGVWDQLSNAGEQVTPGHYDVLGVDVGCEEFQKRCHFGMGLPIEITP